MFQEFTRSLIAAVGAIEIVLYLLEAPRFGLDTEGPAVWHTRFVIGILLLVGASQNDKRGLFAKLISFGSLASVLAVYAAWFKLSRELLGSWSLKYRTLDAFLQSHGFLAGYLNRATLWDLVVLLVVTLMLTSKLRPLIRCMRASQPLPVN
jgi:hypothetical protein